MVECAGMRKEHTFGGASRAWRRLAAAAFVAFAAAQAAAFEWTGLERGTHIGGRMLSPGYLRGKVVILDARDYADPRSTQTMHILQQGWKAFRTKQFVVLGSHRGRSGGDAVLAAMRAAGATYPVYAGADAGAASAACPCITVLDSTGTRRLYSGNDPRQAVGAASAAIFAARRPSDPKQLKFLLDWELEYLPGTAYLRLKELDADKAEKREMEKAFPDDAKRYAKERLKLSRDAEIVRLAKLVELSRLVKDRDTESAKAKAIRPEHLDRVSAKYGDLKKSVNPAVAQEAKNALADIIFAKAEIEAVAKRGPASAGKRRSVGAGAGGMREGRYGKGK